MQGLVLMVSFRLYVIENVSVAKYCSSLDIQIQYPY